MRTSWIALPVASTAAPPAKHSLRFNDLNTASQCLSLTWRKEGSSIPAQACNGRLPCTQSWQDAGGLEPHPHRDYARLKHTRWRLRSLPYEGCPQVGQVLFWSIAVPHCLPSDPLFARRILFGMPQRSGPIVYTCLVQVYTMGSYAIGPKGSIFSGFRPVFYGKSFPQRICKG